MYIVHQLSLTLPFCDRKDNCCVHKSSYLNQSKDLLTYFPIGTFDFGLYNNEQ